MSYYTFDEWNSKGYRIKKGAKAIKIDGVNKFSTYQTYPDLIDDTYHKSKSKKGDGSYDQCEGEYDHQEAFEAIWGSD